MPTSPRTGADPAQQPTRTFRTLPARITGWTLVAAAVVMAVLLVRSERASAQDYFVPLAIVAFVMALVWVVLLRPCVRLDASGVVLRNLVTDVEVPFARLQEVKQAWALELVDTTGRKHSSWAVPTRREFRPPTRADAFADATQAAKSREGVHAEALAGHVEHAQQRWAMEGGATEPEAAAHRRWAPGALIPLGAAAALLVVAILL